MTGMIPSQDILPILMHRNRECMISLSHQRSSHHHITSHPHIHSSAPQKAIFQDMSKFHTSLLDLPFPSHHCALPFTSLCILTITNERTLECALTTDYARNEQHPITQKGWLIGCLEKEREALTFSVTTCVTKVHSKALFCRNAPSKVSSSAGKPSHHHCC
jgi:hypothetical protein